VRVTRASRKSFATKTVIQATPAVIWTLLTNAPDYLTWNSKVDRMEDGVRWVRVGMTAMLVCERSGRR